MIDNQLTIETPELIELSMRPASVWPRAMAFTLDLLIRFLFYIIISIFFTSLLANYSMALIFISLFLIEWFYPVYFEVYHDGVTPGKKVYGLRVVSDDGSPVTFAGSMIRNLLRSADFLPVMYAAGIVCSVLNSSFKRIGDLAAGTLVVHVQDKLEEPQYRASGSRAVPPFMTVDDQNAVLAFAERATMLSEQRSAELASMVEQKLAKDDEDIQRVLFEIANGITGVK